MKKKGNQVVATVHLWSRGSGDESDSETYSENLKDPSEDALRKVANHAFTTLTAGMTPTTGTLVVHAGHESGDVLVDGTKEATLAGGVATIEVPPGPHTITVQVPGYQSPAQQTTIGANAETELTFRLSLGDEAGGGSSFPVRKVAMYTALGVGGALVVTSIIGASVWGYEQAYVNSNDQGADTSACGRNGSDSGIPNAKTADYCGRYNTAQAWSTVAYVTGISGGLLLAGGIYLLVTDDHKDSTPDKGASASAGRVHVLPVVGTRGAAVNLQVAF